MLNLSRRQSLGLLAGVAVPPTLAVAAAPVVTELSAKERADYHWKQFAAAMDEMTAHHSGWFVMGGHRREFLHVKASEWSNRQAIEYRVDNDPRFAKSFVSEHHVRANLGGTGL